MNRTRFIGAAGAAFGAVNVAGISRALADDNNKVTVGTVGAVSDAPLFIANEKGYFKDVGLDVSFVTFNTAAVMIAPMSTGELDAGAGGPSAALYNAALRDIDIKVVADKATTAPGYGFNPLIARTALMKSGKLKKISDLKGLTIANVAPGDSSESVIYTILKKGGLAWDDVKHQHMSFSDQVAAMQSGAVDAGIVTEPNASRAIAAGISQKFISTDQVYPNQQIAVLLYGGPFIKKRPDVAKRFMVAYLRGLRFYYESLKNGHYAGPNAAAVIAILQKYTNFKDAATYAMMTPNAVNPDGAVNLASMNQDIAAWKDLGELQGPATAEAVVDNTFINAAVAQLGRYRR
jgi:NitT/TauT family transport system substrate-binding protein